MNFIVNVYHLTETGSNHVVSLCDIERYLFAGTILTKHCALTIQLDNGQISH